MADTENLKIEDADIVADLSGGKLACQEYLKRIAELKAEIERLEGLSAEAVRILDTYFLIFPRDRNKEDELVSKAKQALKSGRPK